MSTGGGVHELGKESRFPGNFPVAMSTPCYVGKGWSRAGMEVGRSRAIIV